MSAKTVLAAAALVLCAAPAPPAGARQQRSKPPTPREGGPAASAPLVDENNRTTNQRMEVWLSIETSNYEIALANLALQRTSRPDLKAHATLLIADRTALKAAVTLVLRQRHMRLTDDMGLPQNMVTVYDLSQLRGEAFNKACIDQLTYMAEGDRGHDERVLALAAAPGNLEPDPDYLAVLRRFATKDAEREQQAKALQRPIQR